MRRALHLSFVVVLAAVMTAGCASSENSGSGNNAPYNSIEVNRIKNWSFYKDKFTAPKRMKGAVVTVHSQTVASFDWSTNNTLAPILLSGLAITGRRAYRSDTLVVIMVHRNKKLAKSFKLRCDIFLKFMANQVTIDTLVSNLVIENANINLD